MLRIRGLPIALLLCTSGLALAQEKVPGLDKAQDLMDHGLTHDVQMIGWSQDERRYALRVYELPPEIFDKDFVKTSFCKGYLDHTGKPFQGGLSLVLYEGDRQTGGWRIQDAKTCTPPDTARERLAQAKAALAEQGIDLTLLGATVPALSETAEQSDVTIKKDGDKEWTSKDSVVLPHGPWASSTVEIAGRFQWRPKRVTPQNEGRALYLTSSAFELRVHSRKRTVTLHRVRLGPTEYTGLMAGHFSMRFDRLFLSPAGTRLVAFAYAKSGNMRGSIAQRIHLCFLDLTERLGADPKAIAPAR